MDWGSLDVYYMNYLVIKSSALHFSNIVLRHWPFQNAWYVLNFGEYSRPLGVFSLFDLFLPSQHALGRKDYGQEGWTVDCRAD